MGTLTLCHNIVPVEARYGWVLVASGDWEGTMVDAMGCEGQWWMTSLDIECGRTVGIGTYGRLT